MTAINTISVVHYEVHRDGAVDGPLDRGDGCRPESVKTSRGYPPLTCPR